MTVLALADVGQGGHRLLGQRFKGGDILGGEGTVFVHHLQRAQALIVAVVKGDAQEIACLKAGRLVDSLIPTRVGANIIHDLRGTRLDDAADDAGVLGQAQFTVGQSERGAADQLLARFVP